MAKRTSQKAKQSVVEPNAVPVEEFETNPTTEVVETVNENIDSTGPAAEQGGDEPQAEQTGDEQVHNESATNESETDESGESDEDAVEGEINYESEVLKLIAELGFEQVYHKLTAKAGTKMEQAVEIYKTLYLNGDSRRCDVIREFMKKLDMSQDGASTYFQNIKKKVGDR